MRPDSGAVDLQPVRWDRATAGAGRDLDIHYTITGRAECHTLGRVDVAETAQSVTVTLRIGRLPTANCGGPQPMIAMTGVTTVTLGAPLGTRAVRDGAATG